jgi:hypothetical protein
MRGKREVHRKYLDPSFIRKADGQLRPPDERDIKDIWAELDRAKLREAIEKDQKKRARKDRRRGLFAAVKASEKPTGVDTAPKTVEIKINFGGLSFDWARNLWRKLKSGFARTSRKQRGTAVGLLVFVALFAASFNLYGNAAKDDSKDNAAKTLAETSQAPDYTTVLPIDKAIDDLGGWSRVSPPDKEPVFAFVDQIDGVRVAE